jgi:predicted  nucleic acid-binding Zn-ribbon protein|tara:strand:+ start:369 stop:686 length:318 start_codon:yes stop_codon:yes gene_type:complete
MEFIELYAEYGAVGVVVILFAITFIKQSKVTETQAEALNSLQIENEGQSKNIENIESILLKFLDRWNRSDETRDRRHEDLVKEVNDMSDVLMEVKGSVSRINGTR